MAIPIRGQRRNHRISGYEPQNGGNRFVARDASLIVWFFRPYRGATANLANGFPNGAFVIALPFTA